MAASQSNLNYRHNQTREKNPNWKGGRVIASNGYVLIRVGVEHHLADVRGYAYEHRLVAEELIGRRLRENELVHHRNGNKQDNRPENLEVCTGNAHHFVRHRKKAGLRLPGEANPLIKCECGCGETLERYDSSNRPRRYITGHNPRRSPMQDAILFVLSQSVAVTLQELIVSTGTTRASVMSAVRKLIACGDARKVRRGVYEATEQGRCQS